VPFPKASNDSFDLFFLLYYNLSYYSHRLRRVIRQALVTSRKHFHRGGDLMLELSNQVTDMLVHVYPELGHNLANVRTLFRFEEEVFDENLSKSNHHWKELIERYPELSTLEPDQQAGLVAGNGQLDKWDQPVIPGHLAFKLYETYGLQEESLRLLASLKGLAIDWDEFTKSQSDARMRTLLSGSVSEVQLFPSVSELSRAGLPATDTRSKYDFYRLSNGEYDFQPVDATLLAIIDESGSIKKSTSAQDKEMIFITSRSNFYSEAGGQVGDTGRILCPTGAARIIRVQLVQDYVFHYAEVTRGHFSVNHPVQLSIDAEKRVNCMANHTATHLLQAALKKGLNVTCQKSSHVNADYFRFDFGVFQMSGMDPIVIPEAENMVRDVIKQGLPVDRLLMPFHEAAAVDGVTLVPGESYPETVHVIRIQDDKHELVSMEPCCGTHAANTADLQDFAILSVKSSGLGNRSVRAVTRNAAILSYQLADELCQKLNCLEQKSRVELVEWPTNEINIPEWINQLRTIDEALKELRKSLETDPIPYVVSQAVSRRLELLESSVRSLVQEALSKLMQTQVKTDLDRKGRDLSFLVTVLRIPRELMSIGGAKLSLSKATRHCPLKPVLILAVDDDQRVIARASVPKELVTPEFDALKWINGLVQVVRGHASTPKGQNCHLVSNFRSHKLTSRILNQFKTTEDLVSEVARSAERYATSHTKAKG